MRMSPFANFVMALLVTTCAEAVAPPAKTSMSRGGIKAAGIPNNMIGARKQPARGRAAIFREGFKEVIMLAVGLKFSLLEPMCSPPTSAKFRGQRYSSILEQLW